MSNTTTINLSFRVVREDGQTGTVDDARAIGRFLGDDCDALYLEGGRFILDDVRGDDPQVFLGRLEVTFEVDVSPYDGDDKSPAELAHEVDEAAVLNLPEGYEVAKLTVTVA